MCRPSVPANAASMVPPNSGCAASTNVAFHSRVGPSKLAVVANQNTLGFVVSQWPSSGRQNSVTPAASDAACNCDTVRLAPASGTNEKVLLSGNSGLFISSRPPATLMP
ncbi:MAG: hypothetical protein BWY91_03122 [bacterium ADurb.BinA028]|nr:MAG: hypothetical protein BWY91_03122 [bacterium ADurb.BinA028]